MRTADDPSRRSRVLFEGGISWLSVILLGLAIFVVDGAAWSGLLLAGAAALFAAVVFLERKEILDRVREKTVWHAMFLGAFLLVLALATAFGDHRPLFYGLVGIAAALVIGAALLPSRDDGRDSS